MKIYIGADHRGYWLKDKLIDNLEKSGQDVSDIGDNKFDQNDDFTVFAAKAASLVLADKHHDARAILLCGSGQGMVMAANRFKGIRAGLGWSVNAAKAIRNDENSNILALPAELFENDVTKALLIINTWLNTPYANAARYNRRIKQMDGLD